MMAGAGSQPSAVPSSAGEPGSQMQTSTSHWIASTTVEASDSDSSGRLQGKRRCWGGFIHRGRRRPRGGEREFAVPPGGLLDVYLTRRNVGPRPATQAAGTSRKGAQTGPNVQRQACTERAGFASRLHRGTARPGRRHYRWPSTPPSLPQSIALTAEHVKPVGWTGLRPCSSATPSFSTRTVRGVHTTVRLRNKSCHRAAV
jgi:hypothetical protein